MKTVLAKARLQRQKEASIEIQAALRTVGALAQLEQLKRQAAAESRSRRGGGDASVRSPVSCCSGGRRPGGC